MGRSLGHGGAGLGWSVCPSHCGNGAAEAVVGDGTSGAVCGAAKMTAYNRGREEECHAGKGRCLREIGDVVLGALSTGANAAGGSVAGGSPLSNDDEKGSGLVGQVGQDGKPSAFTAMVTVVVGSKVELQAWGTRSRKEPGILKWKSLKEIGSGDNVAKEATQSDCVSLT